MKSSGKSGWVIAALAVAFVGLALVERRRPLRRWRDPSAARVGRNIVIGAITAVTMRALEAPVTSRVVQASSAGAGGSSLACPFPVPGRPR